MSLVIGFSPLHGYTDVDDHLVVAFLDQVGDLEEFVVRVSAWVTALPAR